MSFFRRNILEDVHSDMSGDLGTVLCFHGGQGNGFRWADLDNDKGRFAAALVAQGFSVVCPTARDEMWSTENKSGNKDVQNVNRILKQLNAHRPYFLVGHSNGGGFACRYAAFGDIKPVAVQYSNSFGILEILKSKNYEIPSLFNYSPNDPSVDAQKVAEAVSILQRRRVTVEANDLSAYYAAGGYEHEHEFVNTAATSGPWFLAMEAAR